MFIAYDRWALSDRPFRNCCKRLIYKLILKESMKTFNWLMAAMMVVALSFVACKDPQPEPEPGPGPDDPTKELTFEASVSDVTRTSVFINVTPSDLEAEYLSVVYNAYSVEQSATDAELVAKIYAEISAYAESQDKSFVEYMAESVKRGALENYEVKGLTQATNYYLLVFGVDNANDYAASTPVKMVKFKTAEPQQSSCTFELKSNVYLTTAALTVTPSDNKQSWHLINLTVDEYNAYTAADGEYGWSNEELFQNTLNTELETLEGEGLSSDDIALKLFHTGMRTLNVSGLKAKTQYTAFVAGVNYENGEAYVTTAPKEIRYRSGEAAASDLTFDIEVSNIEHYSADIRITPSDPNAEYYYYIGYIDSKKKSMKPIDIANSAVTEYIYYWENYTELKHRDPVTGVIDLTGDNKFEMDIAETEYYVVAFSFEPNPTYGQVIDEEAGEYDSNPGTITSAPVYVSFKSAEQGDPMTAEFEFSASDVGPYDFYLEIEASDPTIYYQPGIAYAEGFDPQAAIDASSGMLSQLMQMCMESQNPCLTIHEALEKLCYNYYRNGSGRYYIANLEPEKEYIGYVLAIDATTGKFARCVYSDVIAKTTALGSVTPSLELLGVYNGNDENGTIFGDADLTLGRPIVAVKLNNVEGATALYSAISTDPYVDVAALPHRYIISEFRGYWQDVNLNVPYHFFVAEWDMEQTVLAYAQDANGHESGVGLLAVKPVDSGDINELKGYVDEVNNATPKAAAKSLVYDEVADAPAMECVWSEEVGAPRAAEVIYHEVEPLAVAVESDVLSVKTVKSFAL